MVRSSAAANPENSYLRRGSCDGWHAPFTFVMIHGGHGGGVPPALQMRHPLFVHPSFVSVTHPHGRGRGRASVSESNAWMMPVGPCLLSNEVREFGAHVKSDCTKLF